MQRKLICLALALGIATANGPKDPPPSAEEKRAWKWSWEDRKITGKKFWRHDTTQEPPYRPPPGWKYNTSSGPVEGMINLHLIPHTHDDVGWQVTVDQYFYQNVYYIIDTVIRQLAEDSNRRFMYVETGFFARWWAQQPDRIKEVTKILVSEGRLEFINGGWCMHDEASPYYVEMVDQTTRGHLFLKKNFGDSGNPKGTWQIDPFGHSNTQAWLLGAEAGMGYMFWGRMDYQDGNIRKENKGLEWIWRGSESLGDSAQIFAGQLYGTKGGFGYGAPMDFDGSGTQVQDDPSRHDYNVDEMVDTLVTNALYQAAHIKTNHIAWACGSDFNYQNAVHWYHNLDKLIHYANLNGSVNVFYSTPSYYVEQKFKAGQSWEVREDDIFPLADDAHHYWTGYFTSRPALKRQVRFASNFLNAARQMETLSGVTAKEVDVPTTRPSPPVGTGWTDSLEGTIGVATHHDGMSGTERQDVADDYAQRIAESQVEVEAGVAKALQRLMGLSNGSDVSGSGSSSSSVFSHCGCSQMNTCLNMSMCAFTADAKSGFNVIAWSPLGQPTRHYVRIPVTASGWQVIEVGSGNTIPSQTLPIDDTTHNLPLLYINSFGLSPSELAKKKEEYENKATHILTFQAELPSLGFNTYKVSPVASFAATQLTASNIVTLPPKDKTESVSNEFYRIDIDQATGLTTTLTNLKSNTSTEFVIDWGWYNSSTGGCTSEIPGPPSSERQCDSQQSGAYIFRPNSSTVFYPGPKTRPILTITRGPIVTEVKQVFSSWASHVIRLSKGSPFVEVEWTAGPIPTDTPWIKGEPDTGKEVIIRYSTSLSSASEFETDSNGREMVARKRNGRGPSYPQPLNVSEPIAGNYYPVNAIIALKDTKADAELAVIVDVAQGGSSIRDGQLELMVHRRVLNDDSRGVQEPLNETMCGCNDINAAPGQMGEFGHEGDGGCWCEGLTVRGRHWLVLDGIESANAARRKLDNKLNFPPTLTFAKTDAAPMFPKRDFLANPLPENIKLMTLTNNYKELSGATLLRLSHLYAVGEHPTLSLPTKVSLTHVFANKGFEIKSVEETSLTGNQPLKELDNDKLIWKTYEPWNYTHPKPYNKRSYMDNDHTVEIRPMEIRTFWVVFK